MRGALGRSAGARGERTTAKGASPRGAASDPARGRSAARGVENPSSACQVLTKKSREGAAVAFQPYWYPPSTSAGRGTERALPDDPTLPLAAARRGRGPRTCRAGRQDPRCGCWRPARAQRPVEGPRSRSGMNSPHSRRSLTLRLLPDVGVGGGDLRHGCRRAERAPRAGWTGDAMGVRREGLRRRGQRFGFCQN